MVRPLTSLSSSTESGSGPSVQVTQGKTFSSHTTVIPMKSKTHRLTAMFSLVAALTLVLHAQEQPLCEAQKLITPGTLEGRYLAVTWNEGFQGAGMLGVMQASPPYAFVGPTRRVDSNAVVRFANQSIYVVNPASSSIEVFDPDGLVLLRTYQLGGHYRPQDVAVIDAEVAYVTSASTAHLLRLNLATGETVESIDMSPFADNDGNPDQNMMAVHEGRLFVQLRRTNDSTPGTFTAPAMLAAVDLKTETLLDVDPVRAGTQAIELRGTPPRFKMQIVPETNRLFVSATGAFFDAGGIEMIDLTSLQSMGLVIEEEDGETGADLGAFVFVTPQTGYLTFSTDLLLSSHLLPFSLSGGVEPGPELHVSLEYFVPLLLYDDSTQRLFYPEGSWQEYGVHVFDALTGERLTQQSVPTTGQPTDMVLFCAGTDCDVPLERPFLRGDPNGDGNRDIADPVYTLNHLFGGGGAPTCLQSADANDDNAVDVADPVYQLNHLFGGGPPMGAPAGQCGRDPTPAANAKDDLSCEIYPPCED